MTVTLCPQVSYNITGWLEKNKDPLNDTVVDQFKKGQNALLVEIFADHPGQSGGGAADAGGGKGKYRRFTALPTLRELYQFLELSQRIDSGITTT